ncbi:MAG: hypothetical protein ACOYNS_14525 [Bacteroidota bacterium]
MNRSVIILFIVASAYLLTGCVTYTTLQTAQTLPPGKIMVGAGTAVILSDNSPELMPELDARVGLVKNFDIGAKYSAPSLYFVDGKIQVMSEPFALSADLGWSTFNYTDNTAISKGVSTGWYPMLMIGKEHWYAGVKGVYFETKGQVEFFGLKKFQGSGWMYTSVVVGGMLGSTFRLLPEVNVIIPRGGKVFFVPAIGLQIVP